MCKIKSVVDECINNKRSIDNGIAEIGYTVDAYNEYFHTGRGTVSRKGEKE